MNRTLKGLMLCTSLLATATVSADRESFSKFVAQKEAAAVTLECVFEVKSSYGGQERQMERKAEVDGFVIDEKGTVISTMSNVDPGSFYAKAMESEDAYSTRIKSLKYIFPDNTEMPAAVVLRDTDLNIAVLKPLTPPEKPMTFISLSESATPKLLSEAYAIARLGRIARRNAVAISGEVQSIIEKPRTLYVVSDSLHGDSRNTGIPVFDGDGKLYGMTSLYLFPGGRNALGDSDEPIMPMVIPASDLLEVAEQAKDAKPEAIPAVEAEKPAPQEGAGTPSPDAAAPDSQEKK